MAKPKCTLLQLVRELLACGSLVAGTDRVYEDDLVVRHVIKEGAPAARRRACTIQSTSSRGRGRHDRVRLVKLSSDGYEGRFGRSVRCASRVRMGTDGRERGGESESDILIGLCWSDVGVVTTSAVLRALAEGPAGTRIEVGKVVWSARRLRIKGVCLGARR